MATLPDYTLTNWVNNTVPAINSINLNHMDKGIQDVTVAVQALQDLVLNLFTSGMIILWKGGTVPSGWVVCNGANGTPNLTNKFIRAGTASGATGGSDDAVNVSHSHTFSGNALPAHSHTYTKLKIDTGAAGVSSGFDYGFGNESKTTTGASGGTPSGSVVANGVSGAGKNVPAYHTLMYIMKV